MNTIIRFGIDLAKRSFAVCGVDESEQIVLHKALRRSELLMRRLGHDARIIDPRRVAPYRPQGRSGKNDANDAGAICEAAGRPQMRFVPVKTEPQQAILVVHRLRAATVAEHTRTSNQMRGLLAEFGIMAPQGVAAFKTRWLELRLVPADRVPPLAWQTLDAW